MAERRAFLDVSDAERRGVVCLDGRPERLLIDRGEGAPGQCLAARSVARVRRVERGAGLAFVDMGTGPDAILPLGDAAPLAEGAWVEVELRAEPRRRKGGRVRLIGPARGPARVLEPGPTLEERLTAWAPEAPIETGPRARAAAEVAQQEAVARLFALPGGGRIWVEPTRALIAVDVDLGGPSGPEPKRAARAANRAALGVAARVLRLKGLEGLVVIDLIGRGHDGPALLAVARAAFAADNPGVAMDGPGRFGTLHLTIPRRLSPVIEQLLDDQGRPLAASVAAEMVRRVEAEAAQDGGARFDLRCALAVATAARTALARLNERIGARASLVVEPAMAADQFDVTRR